VWFKVRKSLSASYQLHLVTIAGFGGTAPVEAPVSEKARDALTKYCRGLHRPILLGHSYGAFLALWVAARSSVAIERVIAVDGLPYFPTVFDLGATPKSLRQQAEQQRQEIAGEPWSPQPYFDEHIMDGDDAAYMTETTAHPDLAAAGDVRYETLTIDIRDEMPGIKCPVLSIAAGQPWLKSPEDVPGIEQFYRERLGDIEHLEVVVAERARHFVMIDDPDFFIETVTAFAG